jgi:hypothetical protein
MQVPGGQFHYSPAGLQIALNMRSFAARVKSCGPENLIGVRQIQLVQGWPVLLYNH